MTRPAITFVLLLALAGLLGPSASSTTAQVAGVTTDGAMAPATSPPGQAFVDQPMSAPEYQFAATLNADRAAAGLPQLVLNRTLSDIARERSRESLTLGGRLTHYDAAGNLPMLQMMRSAGMTGRLAGENLAENNYPWPSSLQLAESELLASPEHRFNILHPVFNQLGVGIAGPNDWGHMYYAQIFLAS